MRVAVIGCSSYAAPFINAGWDVTVLDYPEVEYVSISGWQQFNLVCFTGGEDVNPMLYGQKPLDSVHYDSDRDEYEVHAYRGALFHRVPMVGICRGAQFLCVMNGGRLIQDTSGHHGSHSVHYQGKEIQVTSDHHQMMWPSGPDYKIRAVSDLLSPYHHDQYGDRFEYRQQFDGELEAVQWGNQLGVQWHPEWMHSDSEGNRIFIEMCKEIMNETI